MYDDSDTNSGFLSLGPAGKVITEKWTVVQYEHADVVGWRGSSVTSLSLHASCMNKA
jgi:hypothetical protein